MTSGPGFRRNFCCEELPSGIILLFYSTECLEEIMRNTIEKTFSDIAKDMDIQVVFNFDEDFKLLGGEVDSLFFAMVVAQLEEETGIDPFSDMGDAVYPSTFNEFVAIYENNKNAK